MDNQTPSKAILKNSFTTEFLESLSCFGLAAAFLLQAAAAQGMPKHPRVVGAAQIAGSQTSMKGATQ